MSLRKLLFCCSVTLLAAGSCSDSATDSDDESEPVGSGVPTEGLVARYSFSGNANDESANQNHGTVYGASLVPDRYGRGDSAYFLDGVDDSISFPRMRYASGSEISVSLWVRLAAAPETRYFVMCSDFGVFQDFDSVGLAISNPMTSNARGAVGYNVWHHFVGTYDGDTIKAYVNNSPVQATRWPGYIADLNRHLLIGFFNNEFWRGSVDDIRIYNRALSPAAVDSLFREYH
ncbi:hypothetical protein GF420_05680 [candidate division GN15 bacterium]|nr:hypothetical protein [candidate division GN15 bacterium]